MTEDQAMKRLKPYSEEMLDWLYTRFAEICRQQGIRPVYIYTPVVHKLEKDIEKETQFMNAAKAAGFAIVDVSDAYENHPVETLRVAEWDMHPNAEGHRLLADRLYQALRENPAILGLDSK